ncbi:MAG: GDP-mannose 4,6-dehydratase [Acidobacteria bacterium]|nr:GDP-mannose 4,6-dehydratase [Acidobacteriota bacterium]
MRESAKYLVTGAAGFLGSTICDRLLSEGKAVKGVDCFSDYYPLERKRKNISEALKNENFEFIEADLVEADLEKILEGIEYIIHLAAQPGVRRSWGEEFEVYIHQNIRLTQKLLEALRNKNIKKFVYASSSSVYGETPELPMKEDQFIQPVSPYGVTKLAAENLAFLYYKAFKVPTVSLRLFTVYGPRQRPDMAFNKFMKHILSDKEIEIYGDGEQTRDFTYVEDVVTAFLNAAHEGKPGEIYNIGGGNRISLNELLNKLGDIVGKDIKIKHIPAQKGEMTHTYADFNRAARDLNYKPAFNLDQGLKNEWEWIKKESEEIK